MEMAKHRWRYDKGSAITGTCWMKSGGQGKKRHQAPYTGRRAWGPALDSRNRSKPARCQSAGSSAEASRERTTSLCR